jgi:hypothetical protein
MPSATLCSAEIPAEQLAAVDDSTKGPPALFGEQIEVTAPRLQIANVDQAHYGVENALSGFGISSSSLEEGVAD